MDNGNWITLGVVVIGFAVQWGTLATKLRVLEERLKSGEAGRKAQGERIGLLETRNAYEDGLAGRKRAASRAVNVVVPPEESGPG
jgi:hypothetical protein